MNRHMPDSLHKVVRLQELLDGAAHNHPTEAELRARQEQIARHRSAHHQLQQEASLVKRAPTLIPL